MTEGDIRVKDEPGRQRGAGRDVGHSARNCRVNAPWVESMPFEGSDMVIMLSVKRYRRSRLGGA